MKTHYIKSKRGEIPLINEHFNEEQLKVIRLIKLINNFNTHRGNHM